MADRQVRLYYFPTSYFSQRVLIALKEKEVKYEPVVVDIHSGEQNEAWYMRINSSGQVPTLQDGEKVIKDSETIVDYIDKEFPSDSKLVPDMSTEMGKEVSKWRKILGEMKTFEISYGIMCYPDLSMSGSKIPKAFMKTKTEIMANIQLNEKKLEQLADDHPDLREVYTAKAAEFQKRPAALNKENIEKALNDLETMLDQVEEQLKKVDADPSKELWFCGQQFTAADITLCVFLGRLYFLGLSERYHSTEKRPRLHAYWEQAKKRPSVKRYVINMTRDLMKRKLMQGAITALPFLGVSITLGLAATLAFIFAKKR